MDNNYNNKLINDIYEYLVNSNKLDSVRKGYIFRDISAFLYDFILIENNNLFNINDYNYFNNNKLRKEINEGKSMELIIMEYINVLMEKD